MEEATDELITAIEHKLMKQEHEHLSGMICPSCGTKMKGTKLDDLAKHLGSKVTCLAGLPPKIVKRLDKALPHWGFSEAEYKQAQHEAGAAKGSGSSMHAAEGSGGLMPSAPPPRKRNRVDSVARSSPLSGRGSWVWWPAERGSPPPRSWLESLDD